MDRFGQREELVLAFPCDFPIKVVGAATEQFPERVCKIACCHDASFTPDKVKQRSSSTGKYQSLTLMIRATSKEQIDAIYQDLKTCDGVLWAL